MAKSRYFPYIYIFHFRRVHITRSTLDHLHGEYEVEYARGTERSVYLAERDVDTFLVTSTLPRKVIHIIVVYNSNYGIRIDCGLIPLPLSVIGL